MSGQDDAAIRRLRRLGAKPEEIPEGFDPDAEARVAGLLGGTRRAASAAVGAAGEAVRDSWTGRTLGAAARLGRDAVIVGTLASGMFAAMSSAGGPAWQDAKDIDFAPNTAWSEQIQELESAYADKMRNNTLIVVDVDALSAMVRDGEAAGYREAARDWMTARAQSAGFHATLPGQWDRMMDEAVDALDAPEATTGFVVARRAGEDLLPGFRSISLVTTHHPAMRDAADWQGHETGPGKLPFQTLQSDGFWQKFVTLHELEHAMDADHAGIGAHAAELARSALDAALGAAGAEVDAAPRDRAYFGNEVYADVKAAMHMIRETGDPDAARMIADWRALPVARGVADGRGPLGLSHFTAPAVHALADDVESGAVDLDALAGDEAAMHALADGYRQRAAAQFDGIDFAAARDALDGAPEAPLAGAADRLEAAGWPTAWTESVRLAVDSYQAHLDCADGERPGYVVCETVDRHGGVHKVALAQRLSGSGRDLAHVGSSFDKTYNFGFEDGPGAHLAKAEARTPRLAAAGAPAQSGPAEKSADQGVFSRISEALASTQRFQRDPTETPRTHHQRARAAEENRAQNRAIANAKLPDAPFRFDSQPDPSWARHAGARADLTVPAPGTPASAYAAAGGAAAAILRAQGKALDRELRQGLGGLAAAAGSDGTRKFAAAEPRTQAARLRRAGDLLGAAAEGLRDRDADAAALPDALVPRLQRTAAELAPAARRQRPGERDR